MYENGEVIRARVIKSPFIFHYGIIIKKDGFNYIAHNPSHADGSPHPIIIPLNDFYKERRYEKSFGVLTNKSSDQLIETFNKIKYKEYNYFFFNCEDFVNQMIGKYRFQSGKIQLLAGVTAFILIAILLLKNKIK